MPGWLLGFLLFVVACVVVSWGARRIAIVGARVPLSAGTSPPGGETIGTLDDYFAKMTEFDHGDFTEYFVTISETDGPKFVQVSAGTPPGGVFGYQFDMPIVDWSRPFAEDIVAEAKRRGLDLDQSDSSGMEFLDIDFTDRSAHDDFARWVLTESFGLPEAGPFKINWG